MNSQAGRRPKSVWLISVGLSLITAAQTAALSALLLSDVFGVVGATVRTALRPFDVAALYASAVTLLIAMHYLFRMRQVSIWLLVSYIGIGSWVAFAYAVTDSDDFQFNALVSLGGIAMILMVLTYAVSLKSRGALD